MVEALPWVAYALSAAVAFLLSLKGQRITTAVLAATALALVLLWAGGGLPLGRASALEHGSWAVIIGAAAAGAGMLMRGRRT